MKPFISSARVRSILSEARTDKEVVEALRRHCIQYGYRPGPGGLNIQIPCRHGVVVVARSESPVCAGPVPVTVSRFFRPRSVLDKLTGSAPADPLMSSTAWADRLELF